MKKCKYCQTEIDSKAKICPNCHKKQGMPKWLIVLGVLILIGVFASLSSNSENDVKEKDSSNADKTEKAKFEYDISNQYHDTFAYYIEGTVKNNTSKDYSYVQIEFVCYDKEGNNLGTALDNTNNLLANENWKYKAMFIGSNSEEVDHCDYHEITKW